ncbi:MAG TPA: HAD family hydrolase [Verrucomicrobiae bacterium]|nr:HAD family hydrolase [Verrucomicrobiae bacterium]
MRYKALATDYDGTIAHHGLVEPATVDALCRLKESGRKLLLVTGRELPDLFKVFSEVQMFHRVVAENGALIYDPGRDTQHLLADPPPPSFAEHLRQLGVKHLSVGRVIVAAQEMDSGLVQKAIEECGVPLEVIPNKGDLMVLPSGVNKATGLRTVLEEFDFDASAVVGVGDAENDAVFLDICGFSVAVANALPWLKERVDWVTPGDHGQGIRQLVRALVENDLAGVAVQPVAR